MSYLELVQEFGEELVRSKIPSGGKSESRSPGAGGSSASPEESHPESDGHHRRNFPKYFKPFNKGFEIVSENQASGNDPHSSDASYEDIMFLRFVRIEFCVDVFGE